MPLRFSITPPDNSLAAIDTRMMLAFVDHAPPPQRLSREREIDVLDPSFISAARREGRSSADPRTVRERLAGKSH